MKSPALGKWFWAYIFKRTGCPIPTSWQSSRVQPSAMVGSGTGDEPTYWQQTRRTRRLRDTRSPRGSEIGPCCWRSTPEWRHWKMPSYGGPSRTPVASTWIVYCERQAGCLSQRCVTRRSGRRCKRSSRCANQMSKEICSSKPRKSPHAYMTTVSTRTSSAQRKF